ncbi:MAG: hypothetical protein JNG85_03215 [Spirochaetaceae bacterium]|nr:hypothetical protein [Spirochaetaceae bacterium]
MKTTKKGAPGGAKRAPLSRLALLLAAAAALSSCAILRAGGNIQAVFLGEEDPAIAEASFPTLIKASELLLSGSPGDPSATLTTASLYVMYASAFVSGPADLLRDEEYEAKAEAAARAGALYRRAFRLLGPRLEARSPGILAALGYESAGAGTAAAPGASAPDAAERLAEAAKAGLARFKKADVGLLYWSAASLLGSFSLDPMSFAASRGLAPAMALLARANELEPGWNAGSIEELYVSVYASLPDYMGGGMAKAEDAFRLAEGYSKGGSASLYVTYATSIAVTKDDYPGFVAALKKALAVDPDDRPESRLPIVLARRRAEVLLTQANRYFLLPEGVEQP